MTDVFEFEKSKIKDAIKNLGIAIYKWRNRDLEQEEKTNECRANLIVAAYTLRALLHIYCEHETQEIHSAILYYETTNVLPIIQITKAFDFISARFLINKLMIRG